MRQATRGAGVSLRRRLAIALVAAGALLAVLAAVAATALVVMRERQETLTETYFLAVTEADAGHILLLDAKAAIDSFLETGNPGALDVLERIAAPATAEGEQPDIDEMLQRDLGADHRVLRLRAEATAALDTWYRGHVLPLVSVVEEGGADAVGAAERRAEDAAFDAMEVLVVEYAQALRAERAATNDDLGRWMVVTTWALGLLATGAIVAGVVVWVFLRRLVTDPLAALAHDARVVADGDVDHRVAVAAPGEVGALAADVEAMRERLVVLLEESARARREVELSHAVLEEQAEELRRSNRDLEQFAYVASHDLQEPLRKVASFTQLLGSRYRGQLDERADQYIDFAVDGAKRMQRLINDLLGFSRVGRIGSEVTDVDLAATFAQVVVDLAPRIEAVGADVSAGDLPTVRGEAPLLAQLLTNLVGNAVKFHRPDVPPVVRVTAERVGAYWQLACADNGIGIDAQYADRVFVIFQRLHARDVYEGTGIGLALAKRIVEYHGGDIWVDGRQDGGDGTVIRWTLPADGFTPAGRSEAASGEERGLADG